MARLHFKVTLYKPNTTAKIDPGALLTLPKIISAELL